VPRPRPQIEQRPVSISQEQIIQRQPQSVSKPDFAKLSVPELKVYTKKYGLQYSSKKFVVQKLEEIWEATNKPKDREEN